MKLRYLTQRRAYRPCQFILIGHTEVRTAGRKLGRIRCQERFSAMTDVTTAVLPKGFEALQPFTETWGKLFTQDERYLFRQQSSMEELKAYYDIAAPRLDAVFDHLEKFPMG